MVLPGGGGSTMGRPVTRRETGDGTGPSYEGRRLSCNRPVPPATPRSAV